MPLYEFECLHCDLRFEELIRGDVQAACPTCRSIDVQKLLSAPAVHTHGGASHLFPVVGPHSCPPLDAPPCGTACCRLP